MKGESLFSFRVPMNGDVGKLKDAVETLILFDPDTQRALTPEEVETLPNLEESRTLECVKQFQGG